MPTTEKLLSRYHSCSVDEHRSITMLALAMAAATRTTLAECLRKSGIRTADTTDLKRELANSLLEGADGAGRVSAEELLELLRETNDRGDAMGNA